MKNILFIPFVFILAACSSQQTVINDKISTDKNLIAKNKEKLATHHVVSGSVAEVQGNIDEAIRQFESALKADPQPSIYHILGRNHLKLNKLAKALKYSKKAVELSPENIEYNFLLGRIYNNARVVDSAIVVYKNIIRLDSNSVQAYYNLGLLIEKDRPTEALKYYNKILDITGPEWQVLVKIADVNERLGNVDETIKTVEELTELNPASLDLQKILVESYIKSDKLDKAIELVDEALLIFPDDLSLIEYKASIHIKHEEWGKGAKEYIKIIKSKDINHNAKLSIGAAFLTEASKDSAILPIAKDVFSEIAKDTVDWQTNVYLGEIALLEGDDSTALGYFDAATQQAEWNPRVWVRYGGLLFDRGEIDTAIVKMSVAVKNFPDEFVINLVLGLSYSQKNQHEDAKVYLTKSAELNPGDLTSLSALGFTLNQLGENEDAITYLNRALAIDGENIQILGMLGLIYDNEKMFEECDVSYSKALELDSTNAFVLNNYAYSLAERDLKLEEALKMSEAAVEADSENSSYLDTFGWIHYKLGNYESAKEYIEKAVIVDAENAIQLDHLGDVYFKLGDLENAKKYWTKAFEIDATIENLKQKIETGNVKKYAASIVVFLIVVFVVGCVPSKPVREAKSIPPGRVIKKVEANRRKISTFRATGILAITSPKISAKANFEVMLKKPDSVKISVYGPFGIELAHALITDRSYKFYDPMNKKLYTGQNREGVIEKILKVNLTFDDLMDALSGSVNLTNKLASVPSHFDITENSYILSYDGVNKRSSVYDIDIESLALNSYNVMSEDGKSILKGSYRNFKYFNDVPVPFNSRIEYAEKDQTLDIEYRKINVNEDDLDFILSLPTDIEVIEW